VKWALEAGVRLIDTAFAYSNEAEIGKALKEVFAEGRDKSISRNSIMHSLTIFQAKSNVRMSLW